MKNLNAVLNDVMNDIMTEGVTNWFTLPADRAVAAQEERFNNDGDPVALQIQGALNSGDPERVALAQAAKKNYMMVKYGEGLDPKQAAEAQSGLNHFVNDNYHKIHDATLASDPNTSFLDRAGNMLQKGWDETKLAAQDLGDKASLAWANATPMERGLAIGIPTALAAGAGALYLRKKQREANKAAGR